MTSDQCKPHCAGDLNATCFCTTLNREELCRSILALTGDETFCKADVLGRENLFSNVPVFLPRADIAAMDQVVRTISAISSLKPYRERVLSWAPPVAHASHGPLGAFTGFDFHVTAEGPKLIEINTNAGGAVLNHLLARAQTACCRAMGAMPHIDDNGGFEAAVISMFEDKWRLQGRTERLRRIAIIDDDPSAQYLYPEFVLTRDLLTQAGYEAVIADPRELLFRNGVLLLDGRPVDLVYNRLVDFPLERAGHIDLRKAYETGAVVVTPNPHNHALLADKRNLVFLSDPAARTVLQLGAEAERALAAVPRTVVVAADVADELWAKRKELFFKPAGGHGSKAVYRGDKLTRAVWSGIVRGGYVAQAFAAPGARAMLADGVPVSRKMDVRLYTYADKTLLVAARLYQGQTTNFRTPGGGFAPVFAV